MNNWIHFNTYAISSLSLWVISLIFICLWFFNKQNNKLYTISVLTSILGILVFASFITILWLNLERPPLRTLGETRLWSTLFLATLGLIVLLRWKFILIYGFAMMMAFVFLIINLAKPEIHEKALMPALQSPWFVPHVIVYILAYALLGLSCLIGFYGLIMVSLKKFEENIIIIADNMVYLGFALLTCGLLFGALWAKTAWGHYWTWDPKETWAFLTWLGYLLYLHYRHYHPLKIKTNLWILGVSFLILLVCWFGINYLPSAQNSVHVYAN